MAEEAVLLESVDYQEEVQVGTEPPPKKRRQLRKKDVKSICQSLSLIEPADILPSVVAGVEGDATHFEAFPERKTLWRHIRSSVVFPDFVKQLIVGYIDLYNLTRFGGNSVSLSLGRLAI